MHSPCRQFNIDNEILCELFKKIFKELRLSSNFDFL